MGTLVLFFLAGKTGVVMEETNKGVMMEEKPNRRWNWIKENSETVVWTGVVIGASAAAVLIARKSARSRKEIQTTLMSALKSGNMIVFTPDRAISIVPLSEVV